MVSHLLTRTRAQLEQFVIRDILDSALGGDGIVAPVPVLVEVVNVAVLVGVDAVPEAKQSMNITHVNRCNDAFDNGGRLCLSQMPNLKVLVRVGIFLARKHEFGSFTNLRKQFAPRGQKVRRTFVIEFVLALEFQVAS